MGHIPGVITLNFNKSRQAVVACAYAKVAPLIWGSPGIGKTTLVESLTGRLFFKRPEGRWSPPVATLIGSTLDPTDIGGPIVILNGEAKRVPLSVVKQLAESPGILFLDEITTPSPAVQAAMLRLILQMVAGETCLHPDCFIAGAANFVEETSGGLPLAAATVNRFCQWEMVPEHEEVEAYMESRAEDPSFEIPDKAVLEEALKEERLVYSAVMRVEGQLFQVSPLPASLDGGAPWPSSRSIERGLRCYVAARILGFGLDVQYAVLAGCIGQDAAVAYRALAEARAVLPSVDQIVADPYKAPIYENEQNHRYALMSVLALAARRDTCATLIYANRITDVDFRVILGRHVLQWCPMGQEVGDKSRMKAADQARQSLFGSKR